MRLRSPQQSNRKIHIQHCIFHYLKHWALLLLFFIQITAWWNEPQSCTKKMYVPVSLCKPGKSTYGKMGMCLHTWKNRIEIPCKCWRRQGIFTYRSLSVMGKVSYSLDSLHGTKLTLLHWLYKKMYMKSTYFKWISCVYNVKGIWEHKYETAL